ncbi:MAG: Sec-independent protein translocase protein TatB [Pseudomonadota bacterium]
MFDFNSWCEFLVIAIVALVVLGPKEIPTVLRFVGKWMYRLRSLSREFKSHIDELVYAAEREDIKKKTEPQHSETPHTSDYSHGHK